MAVESSSCFAPPCSLDQEIGQLEFVGAIDGDASIIDRCFQNDLLQQREITLQRIVITASDLGRLDKDRRATFHVQKTCGSLKRKAQFFWIQQVERRDIVLAKPQMLKAVAQYHWVDEQIGQNDDQGTLPYCLGQFVQNRGELRFTARHGLFNVLNSVVKCAGLRLGGMFCTMRSATQARPTASPCWMPR